MWSPSKVILVQVSATFVFGEDKYKIKVPIHFSFPSKGWHRGVQCADRSAEDGEWTALTADPGTSEKGERQRWSPAWGQVALVWQGGFHGHLPSNSHWRSILNANILTVCLSKMAHNWNGWNPDYYVNGTDKEHMTSGLIPTEAHQMEENRKPRLVYYPLLCICQYSYR